VLKVRVLAALVFAPAILAAIVAGGGVLYTTCFGVAQLLGWEYLRMVLGPGRLGFKAVGQVLVALATCACWQLWPVGWTPLVVPTLTLAVLLAALAQPQPISESMQRAGLVLLGALWCGGLLPYLAVLRGRPGDGLGLSLIALFGCWASDTGAYFAGRAFGRRPLYPAVSPKKTLEGGAGGVMCAVAAALALRAAFHVPLLPQHAAALGALAALAGVMGDLCESLLKRSVGVKDSSHLVPGHGGLFDRFDGVAFAVPAVYIYVTLTGLAP
jgi:phosphatidate cytidylyltransferase